MKHLLYILLLLSPVMAFAEEEPAQGPKDKRVRFVDYDESEVVKIFTHYGYATHIQFAPYEGEIKISIGDRAAWDISTLNNHIFIKAITKEPDTNMTVVTSHRTYNFDLFGHTRPKWPKTAKDMMYQVTFKYPAEIAARAQAEAEAEALREKLSNKDDVVATNWNYWLKGSNDISPTRVYDDNRFTYMEFPGSREMPAVYIVNEDGSESLINTDVRDNKLVVHKVARRLVLRKGKLVTCLSNRSFDSVGIATPTGSTDPDVIRVIKGQR